MKKSEIKIGRTYSAKVTGKIVPVRIDAENPRGGWNATNTHTNRPVRIKSAQRLRDPANVGGTDTPKTGGAPSAPTAAKAEKAAPKAAAKPKRDTGERAATGGKPKAEKPMSLIDAAAHLLSLGSGNPMRCQDMVDLAAKRGLWTPRDGKTPANTLYAAILREIKTKGNASRFTKADRGKFALAKQ